MSTLKTNSQGKRMLNNRLDFITNIKPEAIEAMTLMRKEFIALDSELQDLEDLGCDESNFESAMRCVSLARTNIEIACQFTIKALCLIGEVK
jgi:hypothetical protein